MVSEVGSTLPATEAFSNPLHVETTGPEGGPPVLLLHGWGPSFDLMRGALERHSNPLFTLDERHAGLINRLVLASPSGVIRQTREDSLAVLVGPTQTAPIRKVLDAAGYPEDRVRVVHSPFEAQDFLKPLLREGDVVLYENDLPDHYDEAKS